MAVASLCAHDPWNGRCMYLPGFEAEKTAQTRGAGDQQAGGLGQSCIHPGCYRCNRSRTLSVADMAPWASPFSKGDWLCGPHLIRFIFHERVDRGKACTGESTNGWTVTPG